MQDMPWIEQCSWDALRPLIQEIAPCLAHAIDEVDPDSSHSLYRIRYPYGASILSKGIFHIPNKDTEIVSIYHASIPLELQEALNYNSTMPLGIIAQNSIESFIISNGRVIPATFYTPGKMVSLWRVLDEGPSYQEGAYWNVSSGARTICFLPKITDKNGYYRLKKKHGLTLPIPKHLQDHWNVFSHLARQKSFPESWFSEIIFFSKHWFTHKKDKHWKPFYHFLLNEAWHWSAFKRNGFLPDFLFSVIQENRNLKPNPYLADTAKYLIAIGEGSTPAFVPAIDNLAAPVSGLQQIFLEDYGLRKYAPIIMHTHHFSAKESRPVYYSFQIPTTMIFSPKSNQASTAMMELREVKYILENLRNEVLYGQLGIEKTPLFEIVKNVNYDFFHTERDNLAEISAIADLTNSDPFFQNIAKNSTQNEFPEFSPFFKGCTSVSLLG